MSDSHRDQTEFLLIAKQKLRAGREGIAGQHAHGQDGWTTSAALCDLFFGMLLDFWDDAFSAACDAHPSRDNRITLAPTGGLGRRDIAPYSDLDVTILHEPGDEKRVTVLSQRLLQSVFDCGLQLSLTVRTIKQACSLATKDAEILSSLTDARFLAGSVSLFQEFLETFKSRLRRRRRVLRQMVLDARGAERMRFGETVHLLEPDVKRSRGGLRDVQLLRWVAGVWHGIAEPKDLVHEGLLEADVRSALSESTEFLLRVRHDMHFHGRSEHNFLHRAEQLRLADERGITGTKGLLPVEVFMQTYFFHTNRVGQLVSQFVEKAGPIPKTPSMLARIFRQQVEGDYRIEATQITVTPQGTTKLQQGLAEVIRLSQISATYGKKISLQTGAAVRECLENAEETLSETAAKAFISLLDQSVRLGQALRLLHDLGALERVIPEFAYARGLLQFNAYHKYTVDEHCLRAVEAATEFTSDSSTLGRTYRALPRKYLLHLALLIHDLGKGRGEDHSEIGAAIADDVSKRLRLSQADADALQLLVRKHLLMSHTALRRDTSDPQLELQFAFEVGSPDVLQMLFVLTAADFQAVGPGVLNDWKIDVLTSLYVRTMNHLTGNSPTPIDRLREARAAVRAVFEDRAADIWIDRQIDVLPSAYLNAFSAEQIGDDLSLLLHLEPHELFTRGAYREDSNVLEVTVGVRKPQPEDALSRLAGALSGKGIQIYTVDSYPLLDDRVVYRFSLQDPELHEMPAEARMKEIEHELHRALTLKVYRPAAARRVWQTAAVRREEAMKTLPVQVRADNDTSPDYTILDVFAPDQMALLYQMARTLELAKLRVGFAKMSAHLDQALGVFYVSDQNGAKIEDALRLQSIRTALVKRLEDRKKTNKEP
ncbi:MAG: HD domain-containing protein [Pirellulales bacterium]|nr:HD domain-containing protein [Pirellulales bacterium]